MTLQFLFDNRVVDTMQFAVEANTATYLTSIRKLIGTYVSLTMRFNGINKPSLIGVASTSDTIQLLQKDSFDLKNLEISLSSCFTTMSNINVPNDTWGKFLLNGIQQINDQSAPFNNSLPSTTPSTILIYSTDICLLGNEHDNSVESGVGLFLNECSRLINSMNIHIIIKCVIVSNKIHALDSVNYSNLSIVNRLLQRFEGKIVLDYMINSAVQYDEEMRHLVSKSVKLKYCSLNLPTVDLISCKLMLELVPATIGSLEFAENCFVHDPELVGLVPRSHFNPIFLEGPSIILRSPSITTLYDGKRIFHSLCR